VSIYPGVGHAFVTPEALSVAGAAQDAWNEMLDFLDEALHKTMSARISCTSKIG
jgi:dienelactone hydrolase